MSVTHGLFINPELSTCWDDFQPTEHTVSVFWKICCIFFSPQKQSIVLRKAKKILQDWVQSDMVSSAQDEEN